MKSLGRIRPKTTVTLTVSAQGASHSKSDVCVRDLSFSIDEPEARGGSNTGPTPTETALAALVGCTNVIANKCAKALGVDIGHLAIDISCDFDRRGVTLAEEVDVPFVKLVQNVVANGSFTDEELQKVAEQTAKFCPLSKLFEQAGTQVETIWRRA